LSPSTSPSSSTSSSSSSSSSSSRLVSIYLDGGGSGEGRKKGKEIIIGIVTQIDLLNYITGVRKHQKRRFVNLKLSRVA
jgi:hypothetical protein